jgi:hypothetical protein
MEVLIYHPAECGRIRSADMANSIDKDCRGASNIDLLAKLQIVIRAQWGIPKLDLM